MMKTGAPKAPLTLHDLPGLKVTVMGLGLHGGGVSSAAFFARHGCDVTVTDMKDEAYLEPSVRKLNGLSVRFVLGGHEDADFSRADVVIKNPAVPADNPFLSLARRIETDISVFLSLCDSPVLAVTGTKGKSTTVCALHHVLKMAHPDSKLGGNITLSPLEFLDGLLASRSRPPVVLELSSWQLGDLKGNPVFKPKIAAITNIMPDHQNRYAGMDDYVSDKKLIYAFQDEDDVTLCNRDDAYGRVFAGETRGAARYFSSSPLPPGEPGGYIAGGKGMVRTPGGDTEIVPAVLRVPGGHARLNLLVAGLAAHYFGVSGSVIRDGLAGFPGVEHRLEYTGTIGGARVFNDSAATIPEAAAAAVLSFKEPVILIMGGTDKKLDFSPLMDVSFAPEHVILLEGSAAAKVKSVLEMRKLPWSGPFANFKEAVEAGLALCLPGKVLVFSPGCASFEMFQNEFDRGRRFKELITAAIGRDA